MAQNAEGPWQVEGTTHYRRWYQSLGAEERNCVDGSLRYLHRYGPALPRPFADSIKGARHHNMKELRASKTVRILFAFDGQRRAVLVLGGDKRGHPKRWYRQQVRLADRLLDEHDRKAGKSVAHVEPARANSGRAR